MLNNKPSLLPKSLRNCCSNLLSLRDLTFSTSVPYKNRIVQWKYAQNLNLRSKPSEKLRKPMWIKKQICRERESKLNRNEYAPGVYVTAAMCVFGYFFAYARLLRRLTLSLTLPYEGRASEASIIKYLFYVDFTSSNSMRPHTVKIHSKLKCLCCAGPKTLSFSTIPNSFVSLLVSFAALIVSFSPARIICTEIM